VNGGEYDDTARRHLEALDRSISSLNETASYERVVGVVASRLRDALRARVVVVYRADPVAGHLVVDAIRGRRLTGGTGTLVVAEEGIPASVARRAKSVLLRNATSQKRYSLAPEKRLGVTPRSLLAVPLLHRGDVIGVVEAINPMRREAFDKDDLRLAGYVANVAAVAVANRRDRDRSARMEFEYALFKKVSNALGKSLTLDEALTGILRTVRRLIPFDAASVFVLDRKTKSIRSTLHEGYPRGSEPRMHLKMNEGIVGLAARSQHGIIVDDVHANPLYVVARRSTRSEMVAPLLSKGRVIGLLNVESDHKKAFSRADLRLLEAFAGKAAVSIERAHLYEEQYEKEQIEKELRLARTVQTFFSPGRSRTFGAYRIAGVNYPSLEVSGDLYDVFPVRGDLVAFAIADVAGKGVPAAIINSAFRAILHTVAPYLTSARQIALRANQILMETVRPQDFVTAFIGVLDPKTGVVTYCNAGHNPPVLMSPGGGYRLLETGGTVLGVIDEQPLQEGRFRVSDEVLVCYTDGAVEARNSSDEEFGEERLIAAIRSHVSLPAHRLGRELYREVRKFHGGTRQHDDTTFLVLRCRRSTPRRGKRRG